MSVVHITDHLLHRCPDTFDVPCLDRCKTQEYHRKRPLQPPVLLIVPDRLPLKQVAPTRILVGEEALDRAHIERLAESARSGDQRDLIAALPPFPDEIRLVDIKDVLRDDFLVVLISESRSS